MGASLLGDHMPVGVHVAITWVVTVPQNGHDKLALSPGFRNA